MIGHFNSAIERISMNKKPIRKITGTIEYVIFVLKYCE